MPSPGGAAPAIYGSAGERRPSGSRDGHEWLTAVLVEAAGSVERIKGANCLPAQHARLAGRRGMARVQFAGRPLNPRLGLLNAYPREPHTDLGRRS